MIDFDQISTPEVLSLDDDQEAETDDNKGNETEEEEEEEKKQKKPYSQYVVRLREEPKYKIAKNRFDTYLTKTSIRAI